MPFFSRLGIIQGEKNMWKDIKGYEGLYQVSNRGEVKSLNYNHTRKEKILSSNNRGGGYLCVRLCKKGRVKTLGIHRLVMVAFIKNSENKRTVNHKDGNPSNNNVENLEWATYSENSLHAYNELGMKAPILNGKDNGKSKTVNQLTLDGALVKVWESMRQTETLGFNRSSISACCLGKMRKHHGFKWEFKKQRI